MEGTIGYEALFSAEEWDAIQSGDYSELEEVDLQFGSISPDGEHTETHEVTIYDPPGQHAGNEDRFELECDRCGDVGTADSEQEAKALAKLHESFVATLVDRWTIPAGHIPTVVQNGTEYEVECPTCGTIGNADDRELAAMVGRLHEHAFELAGVAEEVAS